MTSGHHHGVVAIITDPERARFVLQQKDADYRPSPRGFSFFGGAVEPGEALAEALDRELREELGGVAERLIAAGSRHVLTETVSPGFELSLFEIVVAPDVLDTLAASPVLEGERALLVDREGLATTRLIWDLDTLARRYLADVGV